MPLVSASRTLNVVHSATCSCVLQNFPVTGTKININLAGSVKISQITSVYSVLQSEMQLRDFSTWLSKLNGTVLFLFCSPSEPSWNTSAVTGENLVDSLESVCVL